MKIPEKPQGYFEQFRTTPLELKEFDPQTREIANKHIKRIKKVLDTQLVEPIHRGSTAFGILGKGDIDVAVYTETESFENAHSVLQSLYGEPHATGETFASFYEKDLGYDVEISLMKGLEAEIDKALTQLLLGNQELLDQYVELKIKYCYSKREYLIQRDMFFRNIIEKQ